MRGLDPRIHHFSKKMDRRVKPGDDERGNQRRALEKQMAGRKPGHRILAVAIHQSVGSTLMIAAPWLLPIQGTGRPLVSSTKTRRMLVVRGRRYSVISSVLVLSRETRSFDIEPVHTSAAPLLGTTSYGLPQAVGSLYSFIRSVAGSNMPMALPAYSANQRRP